MLIGVLTVVLVILIAVAAWISFDSNETEVDIVDTANATANTTVDLNTEINRDNRNVEAVNNSSTDDDSPLTDEEYAELVRQNQEADKLEVCPSCGVYTGSIGKYCPTCYSEITGGAEYNGGWL